MPICALMLMVGCGSGSSSGPSQPVNGGPNPSNPVAPLQVVSTSPENSNLNVSVETTIEVTFNRSVVLSSFVTGLQVFPGVIGVSACVPQTECRVIRFTPDKHLDYIADYSVTLRNQDIKDNDGVFLESPLSWSFRTAAFVSPANFTLSIDGSGIGGVADAGEATSIEIDEKGTTHIVYYSDSEGVPRHAFCDANCSAIGNWEIVDIDGLGGGGQKIGRDTNMTIENLGSGLPGRLHVSYRDVTFNPSLSGQGILKYALGTWDAGLSTWTWQSIVVDDTSGGVQYPYIKFDAGRIHISYRKTDGAGNTEFLAYATCDTDCINSLPNWAKAEIDTGRQIASPNHLFVSDTAIHISYFSDKAASGATIGTLKYATCLKAEVCAKTSTPFDTGLDWTSTIVDDGGDIFDVGRDNSIVVETSGQIHIAYHYCPVK